MPKDKKPMQKEEVGLHFRIPYEMHEKLREASFNTRKPIAQICREGIELILEQYKKNSTK